MNNTNRNPEANVAEKPPFNREDALNKKGFVEFLAKFPDAVDGNVSSEDMEKRLETFEIKAKVAEEIKKVYKEEVSEAIGIELSSEDMKSVDVYIEGLAVSSPEDLSQMAENIKLHREYPAKIAEANKELEIYEAKIANDQEHIDFVKSSIELSKKGLGVFGKIKMYTGCLDNRLNTDWGLESVNIYTAQRYLEDTYKTSPNLKDLNRLMSEMQKTSDEITTMSKENIEITKGNIKILNDNFSYLKEIMFASTTMHSEITTKAKDKLKERVNKISNNKSPKGINEAVKKVGEVKGKKIFGSEALTEDESNKIEKELDDSAELYVSKKVGEILTNKKFGSKPFEELETALKEITEIETLGTMDKDKTKENIIVYIELYADNLPANVAGNISKKILCKQLIEKLKSKTTSN